MNRTALGIALPAQLVDSYRRLFASEGISFNAYTDIVSALKQNREKQYSLALINVYQVPPEKAKDEVMRLHWTSSAPIVVLAPDQLAVALYQSGAEAWHPQNRSPNIVFANAMALIRGRETVRTSDLGATGDGLLYSGDLVIDRKRRTVTQNGKAIILHRKEFELLFFLARNPGFVMTKEQIFIEVWHDAMDDDHVIQVTVSALRKALSDDTRHPRYIETVHGYGYRFLQGN